MSREQFEAWWNLPPPCHNENTKLAAWEAWQACEKEMRIEIDALIHDNERLLAAASETREQQEALIAAAYEDAANQVLPALNAYRCEEDRSGMPLVDMLGRREIDYLQDFIGGAIVDRTPADAKKALDERDMRIASAIFTECEGYAPLQDILTGFKTIIERVKNENHA